MDKINITEYNRKAWDANVKKGNQWTIPVTDDEIEKAKKGEWQIVLTPIKPVPQQWFGNVAGKKILCLASGGGQQVPILAAAGAIVTSFDNSPAQLQQDEITCQKHGLKITTIQGDMNDLSALAANEFDIAFNPCSTIFVEDVKNVYRQVYRVMKPQGCFMTGFTNPVLWQMDEEEREKGKLELIYAQPYSDLKSLPANKLQKLYDENESIIFAHTLEDLLGGQLQAGMVITHLFEDTMGGKQKCDELMSTFMATRAIKL